MYYLLLYFELWNDDFMITTHIQRLWYFSYIDTTCLKLGSVNRLWPLFHTCFHSRNSAILVEDNRFSWPVDVRVLNVSKVDSTITQARYNDVFLMVLLFSKLTLKTRYWKPQHINPTFHSTYKTVRHINIMLDDATSKSHVMP